jgi:hypothetical protein
MTLNQLRIWKEELVASLQAVCNRFNADHPESRIDDLDALRNALGIRIVQPNSPSCYLQLEFQTERHPAIVAKYTRRCQEKLARRTTEEYPIISSDGEPLLLDDIGQALTADDFAETVISMFPIPAAN